MILCGWWTPLKKGPPAATLRTLFFLCFFLLLFIAVYISPLFLDTSAFLSIKQSTSESVSTRVVVSIQPQNNLTTTTTLFNQTFPQRVLKFPEIDCSGKESENPTPKLDYSNGSSSSECPSYFRWIHEDLKPWKDTGITREAVERARGTANFRLIILKGKLYVEKYKKSIQTRDKFTIWGILQLLRKYPGKLPDLELMFDCDDRPVIRSENYNKADVPPPPPLFRYCGDRWTMDIVFPDWSFWGWAEINIRPWDNLLKELKQGNERRKWEEREPYAYWKGNPFVAENRKDLLTCNVSDKHDWGARLYIQDWIKESQQGFKESSLANQCKHRYKIYIEGYAWSVSEKYILACDSVTFLVKPYFYDFFTRSLEPLVHYWPIKRRDKCQSIKFGVQWGNQNPDKARAIGRAASNFIHEKVNMDYIYDYMFHLLNEYGKLLRFDPQVPTTAVEVSPESMACGGLGLEKKFMLESLVKKSPSLTSPCEMVAPFETKDLERYYKRNLNTIRRVHNWESQYLQENKNHD
ncbi:Protein O-glucosyltransferase 1 [Linum perenne]